MTTDGNKPSRTRSVILNIPNQLTSLRLLLAVVLFCFIAWECYITAMVLFIIAASTDWLDGYYARKYGQVTTLGRILDPFADKVIICGTFIYLIAIPEMTADPFGLKVWMVVVIVGRELLVTAIRSFIEERGSDFSAKMAGKLKMAFQCIAAGVALLYLSYPSPAPGASPDAPIWVWIPLVSSIWIAVILTVYSGIGYVVAAVKILKA
jgi:CDP-diacylglycerol--glycerol-3-phosphate 3-phosphatidyltransferase